MVGSISVLSAAPEESFTSTYKRYSCIADFRVITVIILTGILHGFSNVMNITYHLKH